MNTRETQRGKAGRGLLGGGEDEKTAGRGWVGAAQREEPQVGLEGTQGDVGVFGGGRSVSVVSGASSLQERQPPAPQPTGQRAPRQSSHCSADCTQLKIAPEEEEGVRN